MIYAPEADIGMAITALSNAGSSLYLQPSSNLATIQSSLQSLQRSLGNGNLSAAQTTFTQLQKAAQNLGNLGEASAPSAQTLFSIAALGTALGNGDLSGAKSAFSTVQSDLANVNSLAITAAVDSANQAVQQIDALLGTASTSTSSSLDSLLGASSATSDIASQTTSILGTVYGNHAPATSSSGSTTGSNVNVSA